MFIRDIFLYVVFLFQLSVFVRVSSQLELFDSCQVQVTILDVNDETPKFALTSQNIKLPENVRLSSFYTAAAYDMDKGLNARILYSLTGTEVLLTGTKILLKCTDILSHRC